MKKVTTAVLIAGLALSATVLPSHAAKKPLKPPTRISAEVSLEISRGGQGDQYTPPGKARFFGKVTVRLPVRSSGSASRAPHERFCQRREIRLHIRGKDHPVSVFVNTDSNGEYEFVRDEPVPGSEYRARALKKIKEGNPKKWKRGRKLVCRAGRSNILVVP